MIEKLALGYSATEDRLIVTIHWTTDKGVQAQHLQITRRMCTGWLADLSAMNKLRHAQPRPTEPATRSGAQSGRPATTTLPPATGDVHALASSAAAATDSTPILVTRITCGRRTKDGRWVIKFQGRSSKPCSLVLSDRSLIDLTRAVHKQVQAARWDLADPEVEAPGSPAKTQRQLH